MHANWLDTEMYVMIGQYLLKIKSEDIYHDQERTVSW